MTKSQGWETSVSLSKEQNSPGELWSEGPSREGPDGFRLIAIRKWVSSEYLLGSEYIESQRESTIQKKKKKKNFPVDPLHCPYISWQQLVNGKRNSKEERSSH